MRLSTHSLLPALLLACGTAPPGEVAPTEPGTAARTPVRLALNWYPEPEFGGFYEGVLGGTYAAAGFDVEIVPGGPGAPTLELLASGKAEAAITAADDLLVKRHKGASAVAVWAAFQDSPLGLMVHEATGPTTIRDLGTTPDLTVAIEVGGPFQRFLWDALSLEGKVEAVPYGGSVGPFLADPRLVQQAYITSEPCLARSKGAEIRFLKAADAGWNPYGTVLAVADPPPPWTDAFVAATHRSWQQYLASPDRANQEIARLNDQIAADLLGCITDAQRPFVLGHGSESAGAPEDSSALGRMTADRWAATLAQLEALDLVPAGATDAGAWRPLPAATPSPK